MSNKNLLIKAGNRSSFQFSISHIVIHTHVLPIYVIYVINMSYLLNVQYNGTYMYLLGTV